MHLRVVSLAVDFCKASIPIVTSRATFVMASADVQQTRPEALGDACPMNCTNMTSLRSQSPTSGSIREVEIRIRRSRLPYSTKDP